MNHFSLNKAKSFLRKTLKAALWVVITFVITFIIVAAIIQIPGIQNKIVRYAISFVSNKTHTRVEIKNISISFPKAVVIEGLFLEDLKKDTLLYAGKVKINIALFDLLSSKISINSFALDGVNLNLCRTNADSLFNFNFLLTAFSDTTNQTKVKPQSPSKWTFSIDRVSLKNSRFNYNDEYRGMNVTALLGNLKLTINEIDFGKSIYGMDELLIESLKANVLIKKTTIVSEKKSDGVLPKITVNKIRIINSTVNDGGTTIIMVTHSPTYAEYGSRIIHLFDGHVVTENFKESFRV